MRTHRHRVLVVEDDEDTRDALESFLSIRGFDVLLAENGRSAIARLRSGVDCCVILLDWHMPEIDGAAFMAVRRTDPAALAHLPVVIATGDPHDAVKALKAVPVLAKPFDPEVLARILLHEIDGHRVRPASRDYSSTACRPGPASSGDSSP